MKISLIINYNFYFYIQSLTRGFSLYLVHKQHCYMTIKILFLAVILLLIGCKSSTQNELLVSEEIVSPETWNEMEEVIQGKCELKSILTTYFDQRKVSM